MKKFLSLLTVGALLASASGINAANYYQRGKAAASQAWQGSQAQQLAQQARGYAGAGVAMSRAQAARASKVMGAYLSELGNALNAQNKQQAMGVVAKYKKQAQIAGLVALGVAIGVVGSAVTRWIQGGGIGRSKEALGLQMSRAQAELLLKRSQLSKEVTRAQYLAIVAALVAGAAIDEAVERATKGTVTVIRAFQTTTDLPVFEEESTPYTGDMPLP